MQVKNLLPSFRCFLRWTLAALVVGCQYASADTRHYLGAERRFLPYVEAAQVPLDNAGIWLSDSEVAFNVQKPEIANLNRAERNEITGGNDPDYFVSDHARFSDVWILDVRAGTGRQYKSGRLSLLSRPWDNFIKIAQQSYRKRNPAPGEPLERREYGVYLEGPLGRESAVTLPLVIAHHPTKCPGEPPDKKPGNRRQLRPQDGCIDILYGSPPDLKPIYYRGDGKVIELDMSRQDIASVSTVTRNWVEWLQAYLLKDYSGIAYGIQGTATQSIPLMKPDGRLLRVPLDRWDIRMVVPTRAGMAGVFVGVHPRDDGLYLWNAGSILQIAEGEILSNGLIASPDGCKLAYRAARRQLGRISRDDEYRLRVIDVCRAFNLAPDANPFLWPES